MIAHRATSIRTHYFFLLLVTAYALFQSAYGAWSFDWTYDEPWHLMWNKAVVEQGSTSRELPGNFQSTTPILVPNVVLGKALEGRSWFHREWSLFGQRVFNLVWVAVLILSVFVCGRQISGPGAGLLAAAAVALDPNLTAHSSVATVDLSFASAFLVTLAFYFGFLRQPNMLRAVAVGCGVGLVLASKFTGVLLPLTLVVTLPIVRLFSKNRSSGQTLLLLFLVALTAISLICAAYLFIGIGVPFRDIRFYSSQFHWLKTHAPVLRLPLPKDFLTGVDQCLAKERNLLWNVIFLGRLWPHGTWSYFPVVWLLKTPLFLVAMSVMGFTLLAGDPETRRRPELRFLVLLLVFHLYYFMFIFQTQVGIRYVLFCVPVIYLIAACAVAESTLRVPAWLLCIGMLSVLGEVVPFSGNLLAFTSVLVQPKTDAVRYFADSNLDWGQNERRLRIASNERFPGVPINPVHLLPRQNLVKVNFVSGVWFNFPQYAWVRAHLSPELGLDHTTLLYVLTDEEFEQMMRDERRLVSRPETLVKCSGSTPYRPLLDPLKRSASADSRVCLRAVSEARVRFRAFDQTLNVARSSSWKGCSQPEKLERSQEAWFDLEPGIHELCVNAEKDAPFAIELIRGSVEVGDG
ncbi:MAG: glycosyltransferase family 39 protein [Bdellovibrionota bacterium]